MVSLRRNAGQFTAINPGDVVFVEVWNISPTQGYAYFYNYSTQTGAEYYLTAPAGTKLKGNSIEWIVESPTVNGTLASGTNYINSSFPYNIAWNYNASNPTYYYPGSSPSGTNLELINQVDNKGVVLSSGVPVNFDFVYFRDSGPTYGSGSPPPSDAATLASSSVAPSP